MVVLIFTLRGIAKHPGFILPIFDTANLSWTYCAQTDVPLQYIILLFANRMRERVKYILLSFPLFQKLVIFTTWLRSIDFHLSNNLVVNT